jgi:hypothetical protein
VVIEQKFSNADGNVKMLWNNLSLEFSIMYYRQILTWDDKTNMGPFKMMFKYLLGPIYWLSELE